MKRFGFTPFVFVYEKENGYRYIRFNIINIFFRIFDRSLLLIELLEEDINIEFMFFRIYRKLIKE